MLPLTTNTTTDSSKTGSLAARARSRGRDRSVPGTLSRQRLLEGKRHPATFCTRVLPVLSTRLNLVNMPIPRSHQDLRAAEPDPPTRSKKGGEGTRRH